MGWPRKPSHSPTWSRASRPKVTNRRFAAASGRAKAMTHKVFIDGAAGTTGLEIAERLAGRSEFALVTLPDAERKSAARRAEALNDARSEEHTSELQSLMRISYAVFCLKTTKQPQR